MHELLGGIVIAMGCICIGISLGIWCAGRRADLAMGTRHRYCLWNKGGEQEWIGFQGTAADFRRFLRGHARGRTHDALLVDGRTMAMWRHRVEGEDRTDQYSDPQHKEETKRNE